MFLSDDPLGDRLDMLKLVWTVKDVERAQEAFLSSPRLRPLPFDPAQFSDGETPPPKAAYMLLDRPMPESAEGLSLETMPRLLGQALLVRPADRPRGPAGSDGRGRRRASGGQRAWSAKRPAMPSSREPKQEVVGHWSASQKLLRAAWQPPRGTSPEQLRALLDAAPTRRDSQPLARPEAGRSRRPLAAAKPPATQAYRVRLLAAILVLEHWSRAAAGPIRLQRAARRARPAACSGRSIRGNSRSTTCRRCGWGG